jgi:hypothetical protein
MAADVQERIAMMRKDGERSVATLKMGFALRARCGS